MKLKKQLIVTVVLLFYAVGSHAEVVLAEADTYVLGGMDSDHNFNYPNGVGIARLLVRSLSDPVRAQYAYIRFDLSTYTEFCSGTIFSLTSIGGDSWSSSQIDIYGLTDGIGLTTQTWGEGTLTYNTTGSEMSKPVETGADPFGQLNLVYLGSMPAGAVLSTALLSSTSLDAFLNDRAGSAATLIVANRYNTNRELIFASREADAGVPALITVSSESTDYFVATDGLDTNPGTLQLPFASLQHANELVEPGDTVYIRGGTYMMSTGQISRYDNNLFARVMYFDRSGTADRPIRYWAYGDEQPVFDFTNVTPAGYRVYAFSVPGSWIHFKGIEVIGVQVTITNHTQSICFENNGDHNVYEQLDMHDNQAIGIYCVNGSSNLFLNCDAYNNWDYTSEGGGGGNVDGFGCHPNSDDTGNVFYGCRAWFNSDDGFDLINSSEAVRIENCWAFYNGYNVSFTPLGDGNGFKAGGYGGTPVENLPSPIPRHVVHGCLAVNNKASGLYANHHIGGCDWINNTAYRNKYNFNMLGRLSDNMTDVDGYGHYLVNNLSYLSRQGVELSNINHAECTLVNNSFDQAFNPVSGDFQSLDETQLTRTRKANGDLPEITLLRPATGSSVEEFGISQTERIAIALPAAGADLRLSWRSMDYPNYLIEWSTNLTAGSWSTLSGVFKGTGDDLGIEVDTADLGDSAVGFFRVERTTD